jgi:hypothetical protein
LLKRVTPELVIGPRLARTRWANPPGGLRCGAPHGGASGFSLLIGCRIPAGLNLRLYEQETASRELEEIGFSNGAINVWVQDVDRELLHCLPGADRTIGRYRAPDRA